MSKLKLNELYICILRKIRSSHAEPPRTQRRLREDGTAVKIERAEMIGDYFTTLDFNNFKT